MGTFEDEVRRIIEEACGRDEESTPTKPIRSVREAFNDFAGDEKLNSALDGQPLGAFVIVLVREDGTSTRALRLGRTDQQNDKPREERMAASLVYAMETLIHELV